MTVDVADLNSPGGREKAHRGARIVRSSKAQWAAGAFAGGGVLGSAAATVLQLSKSAFFTTAIDKLLGGALILVFVGIAAILLDNATKHSDSTLSKFLTWWAASAITASLTLVMTAYFFSWPGAVIQQFGLQTAPLQPFKFVAGVKEFTEAGSPGHRIIQINDINWAEYFTDKDFDNHNPTYVFRQTGTGDEAGVKYLYLFDDFRLLSFKLPISEGGPFYFQDAGGWHPVQDANKKIDVRLEPHQTL
jgi:hypothetical protein